MQCTVCASTNCVVLETISFYNDYSATIYDCNDCDSRFTPRDNAVYEQLHSTKWSTYGRHQNDSNKLSKLFTQNDSNGIREWLSGNEKNKFVFSVADGLGDNLNILEVGCSTGYLASYFLSMKHKVLGVDISQSAVTTAKKLFGENFCLVNDERVTKQAPYDFIYFVGTIGCVDNPIEFIKSYLSLLKKDGVLAFNAPNKQYAKSLGKIWPYSTTPPDLVTVFASDFWSNYCQSLGDISTRVDYSSSRHRVRSAIKDKISVSTFRSLRKPSVGQYHLDKLIDYISSFVSVFHVFFQQKRITSEFGVFVTIRKK